MPRRLSRRHRNLAAGHLLAMLALLVLPVHLGCSGEEDAPDMAAAQPPPVDPRYATADALVAEFNRMTTTEPVNAAGMLELIYAENQLQRDWLDMGKSMIPIHPLEAAMQKRFKQPLIPGMSDAFVPRANKPASITGNQGERATATYKDWDGSTENLQLVKYNGRWWISGYTIEHDDEVKNVTADQRLFMTITMRALGSAAPGLTARVEAGEFRSAEAVRSAMQAAIAEYGQRNPNDAERMRAIVERNPQLLQGRPPSSR